jgi:hypothetical protein
MSADAPEDTRPCLRVWEVAYLRLWLRHQALERAHEDYIIWEIQHGQHGLPRAGA